MANIGDSLMSPENGWKRIELNTIVKAAKNKLVLNGNWSTNSSEVDIISCDKFTSIKFKFNGSKLRIINYWFANRRSFKVIIDGEIINDNINISYKNSNYILSFSVENLEKKEHEVLIYYYDDNAVSCITAIDIGEEDTIDSISFSKNTSITNIGIGQYIPCKYTATSNTVGVFSDLGGDGEYLPITPTATPNGYFNWIMVGYDERGRKKLIADRLIQNGISWDTLNAKDYVYGNIAFENRKDLITRLLTGGIHQEDYENEYYKLLIEFDLYGLIESEKDRKQLFNFVSGYYEMTQTISQHPASISQGDISLYDYNINSYGSTSYTNYRNYRPVLLVDTSGLRYLYKDDEGIKTYSDGQWRFLENQDLTNEVFLEFGMEEPVIDISTLSLLNGKPKVLVHNDSGSEDMKLSLNVKCKDSIAIPKGNIGTSKIRKIDFIKMTTNGAKALISFDSGVTYNTYIDDNWQVVDLSSENIYDTAISKEVLETIPSDKLGEDYNISSGIRIAYVLRDGDSIEKCEMQFDHTGRLLEAATSIDYDLEYLDTKNARVYFYKDGTYIVNIPEFIDFHNEGLV